MLVFPVWMKQGVNGVVSADPDLFYPAILEELGREPGQVDAYWLEVAYQIMKLDVQFQLALAYTDPRVSGRSLVINVSGTNGHKARWAQSQHPPGKMATLNQKYGDSAWKHAAKDARLHFERLRGVLPA